MKARRNIQMSILPDNYKTHEFHLPSGASIPFNGVQLFVEHLYDDQDGGKEKWASVVKGDRGDVALHIIYPSELYFYDSLEDMKAKQLDKRGRFGENIWYWVVRFGLKSMKQDVLSIGTVDKKAGARLGAICDRLNIKRHPSHNA